MYLRGENMCERDIKNDILFDIDMEMYFKYNDEFCIMNDYLGELYSYRDIEELDSIRKDDEIHLLRKYIKEVQEDNYEPGLIKKMAVYIENNAIENICIKENCFADKDENGHCEKCINCIIDYFKKGENIV